MRSLPDAGFAVCRLGREAVIPAWAIRGTFSTGTRIAGELSVACPEWAVPEDVRAERGGRARPVAGVPDFAPVDAPIPQSVALARVEPFILDLNGGTVPSFDPDVSSDPNNFRIIDFLLLLEMVETAFYQVNVPRFFGH